VSVAKQFGTNLARLRKRADQSQEETAVRASVHRTEISHLERGLRVARVDTVAKLAAALEVDPGDFFEGIVWQPGDVRYGQFKPDDPATL
jgi:transcriptional regulator with XRE-family HTH domain